MPIDFEEMKKRNTQNSKLRKSEKPIIKPLINVKKNIANEREIRNEQEKRSKIIKKLIEKVSGENNNMVKNNKKTKKGSSGLERASNTKKDYDYLMGDIDKAQQKIPNEPTIGVKQPLNNNIELLKIADNIGKNQGNNGGGNNFFEEMGKKLLFDKLNNQQQKPETINNAIFTTLGRMVESADKRADTFAGMLFNEMRRPNAQPQEDPEEKLLKSMNLVKQIQGEHRERTKDEMDYSLRKDEMVLKESARQDMLNREERATIRDDKKSEQLLNIGGVVLDKIIGNGLGGFIDDVMGAKNRSGKSKRRGRASEQEQFDPSLLDEL